MAKVYALISFGDAFMGMDLYMAVFGDEVSAREEFLRRYGLTWDRYNEVFEYLEDEGIDAGDAIDEFDTTDETMLFVDSHKSLFFNGDDDEGMLNRIATIVEFDTEKPVDVMVIGQSILSGGNIHGDD